MLDCIGHRLSYETPERPSRPVTGPTPCPASVRVARQEDEEALLALMLVDLAENAATIAPPDPDRIMQHIRACTRREIGQTPATIGVIDGPDGPVACICLMPYQWWWSTRWFVQEVWNFVHPDHRRSRHAADLVNFSKWFVDQFDDDGPVYLLSGVTSLHRTESKVRFYTRLTNYVGAFFIYPMPGATP